MIFELKFVVQNFQNQLGFLLQQVLLKESVDYALFEQDEELYLWIDCNQTERLEALVQRLSNLIPQSLFIFDVSSRIVENALLPKGKRYESFETFSYCPSCLVAPKGQRCAICQKKIPKLANSQEIAQFLANGGKIRLSTESGEHTLSLIPSQRVYCVDLANVLEVCHLTSKELQALVSYEKPILRVRASEEFAQKIQKDEIMISSAHDLELLELFNHLKDLGIHFIYGASEFNQSFDLVPYVQTPQEMIVLENDRALILSNQTYPKELEVIFKEHQKKDKAYLATILEENKVKDKNILSFYFSLKGEDKVCLYNAQTQWFNEVMDFPLPKDLFELLKWIRSDEESGEALIENYQRAYPERFAQNVSFDSLPRGIVGVWEIARIVLGISEDFLSLARKNLTQRGVAIDYVFKSDSLIAQKFQIIKCIRSGMSFKLAGVEDGVIALGYIESFSLLPSKLYLSIRQLIEVDGIALSGDLFASKMMGDFFYKNNRQVPIYRNLSFPLLFQ